MKKLSLFCLLALTSGALSAQAALDSNTVADINGKPLTKEEFNRRYKESVSNFRYTPPTKANVLNDIVNLELGAQEARRQGLDKTVRVQEQINAILYQSLMEKQLSEKFKASVDISEKEARDYCRRNPAVRFTHVYVALPPAALKTAEAEARKKIQSAQAALSRMSFEKAVAEFSDGFSTANGGDTGFVNKMQIDPTLYSEARKMKVGEVSKAPVRSQMGFHLMKLTGVQDCGQIDIPEWQRMVFDEKRAKLFEDYLSTLRAKAKVSINRELIQE